MLFFNSFAHSRSGGTGRRSRLKICRGSLPVWVRLPPPGPTKPLYFSGYFALKVLASPERHRVLVRGAHLDLPCIQRKPLSGSTTAVLIGGPMVGSSLF